MLSPLPPFAGLPLGLIGLDYDSWTACIDAAAERGLPLVELYLDAATTDANVRAAAEQCRQTGVAVNAVGSLAKLAQAEDDEVAEHRRLIERSIEVAGALGASKVAFMYGGSAVLNRRDARVRFIERVAPLVDRGRSAGVQLLIENVFSRNPAGDLDTVENVLALFDVVDTGVLRLNFDVGNVAVAGDEAYPYAWEAVRPVIGSVHLKDVARFWAGRHRTAEGCRPLLDHRRGLFVTEPLGRGSVNIGALVDDLLDLPQPPPLMLESFSSGVRRERWVDESLRFIAGRIASHAQSAGDFEPSRDLGPVGWCCP